MHKAVDQFIKLVDERGAASVAVLLCHDSTRRVERWHREKRIPDNQIKLVEKVIQMEIQNHEQA